MRYFSRWLVTALIILMVPHLVSGVHVAGFGTALAVAFILALLNVLIRPLLILITLPLTVMTLGFFILIINALLFQFAGGLVSGFEVDSFGSAFLASLIVSFVSWFMNISFERREGKVVWRVSKKGDRVIDLERGNDEHWR